MPESDTSAPCTWTNALPTITELASTAIPRRLAPTADGFAAVAPWRRGKAAWNLSAHDLRPSAENAADAEARALARSSQPPASPMPSPTPAVGPCGHGRMRRVAAWPWMTSRMQAATAPSRAAAAATVSHHSRGSQPAGGSPPAASPTPSPTPTTATDVVGGCRGKIRRVAARPRMTSRMQAATAPGAADAGWVCGAWRKLRASGQS
mmetsp:Transcript_58136/g.114389  ORF Transcript_58136/g.114389 Transcript_58136/m.114389 type:complete len:207 (-) Transcript_58136:1-621(-)